jgi:hypothetical protein
VRNATAASTLAAIMHSSIMRCASLRVTAWNPSILPLSPMRA